MAPLLQKHPPFLAVVGPRHARARLFWPFGSHQHLSLLKRPSLASSNCVSAPLRYRHSVINGSFRRRAALAISAAPTRAQLQTKGPGLDEPRDQSSWRQNPSDDGWERQPLKPQSGKARNSPYGGVLFEAEEAEPREERPEPDVANALVRRPEAVLSTLDSLKREDFAIGVIAVALGVGAAQVTTQVAQRSSAAVRSLGAGLSRSQEDASQRARLWLNAFEQDARKQAAVSQESLKEWPDLVQASIARFTEKEATELQQLRSNVSEWAAEMPETMPGVGNAVQSLWKSASDAAKRFQVQLQSTSRSPVPQVTQAMPSPSLDIPEAIQETKAAPASASKALEAPCERDSPKLLREPYQAAQPVTSLPARTSATADTSMTSRGIQTALPPAEAPAAAALLPAAKEPVPRKAGRSDTQVYAAEAQASKLKPEPVAPSASKHDDRSAELMPESLESASAKHGTAGAMWEQDPVKPAAAPPAEKGPPKQAEEAWNERIKGAYAAVAASTPYRPTSKKPSSNALSWHRGGNTLLLKPDFQVPKQGIEESSSGGGSGSGSAGGSGGSSSGGGDGESGDADQPGQNPREWLWAKTLLAASAVAAAAEQALQWPRRRARLLALLAAVGFLAFKAMESQSTVGRRSRRKVSRNPMGSFGFGGRRSGQAGIAGGELMDFSDEDSF